jgi:hypothetical protein
MKKLCVLGGTLFLLAFVSGCEVTPSGGASVGVYGEYPSTYSGEYYSYPAYPVYPSYPYYGHGYSRGYYDREHWDHGRRLERHERYERHENHYGRRDRDDRH